MWSHRSVETEAEQTIPGVNETWEMSSFFLHNGHPFTMVNGPWLYSSIFHTSTLITASPEQSFPLSSHSTPLISAFTWLYFTFSISSNKIAVSDTYYPSLSSLKVVLPSCQAGPLFCPVYQSTMNGTSHTNMGVQHLSFHLFPSSHPVTQSF